MDFEKIYLSNHKTLDFAYIADYSGGYISYNQNIFDKIPLNKINLAVLEKSVFGTPIFKFGDGGAKILLLSGVHGDELPPQIASLNLINFLVNKELKDTVYIIPFVAPFATMNNSREFIGRDLNRTTHLKYSLTGSILSFIKKEGIRFVGDFHSSAKGSNPGCEAIFSSGFPSIESWIIASYIAQYTSSRVINLSRAGMFFKGAIEDECNLINVPAVTCEVLSPFGEISPTAVRRSFLQMKSFLSYFGID